MDKFLETYNLSRLNQEETETMNRPITSNKIESAILKLPTYKSRGSDSLTGEFYQIFKDLMPIFLKLFQKLKKMEHFHSLQGQHHADNKTRQRHQ